MLATLAKFDEAACHAEYGASICSKYVPNRVISNAFPPTSLATCFAAFLATSPPDQNTCDTLLHACEVLSANIFAPATIPALPATDTTAFAPITTEATVAVALPASKTPAAAPAPSPINPPMAAPFRVPFQTLLPDFAALAPPITAPATAPIAAVIAKNGKCPSGLVSFTGLLLQ